MEGTNVQTAFNNKLWVFFFKLEFIRSSVKASFIKCPSYVLSLRPNTIKGADLREEDENSPLTPHMS